MSQLNNPKYDGTIHPEEWVKQIQLSFYDTHNKITKNEQEIVNYCKLLIHPSIKILPETNSFIGLINDLKSDISYDVFKNSVKNKLQFNYNISTDENETLKFLNQFQQLLYEGEITEIGEQKKLFLDSLPKESIQYIFINHNFDKINSIEELFNHFYESFTEESKSINDGSHIALKHVTTGKYLSSKTNNMVFAGPTILDINSVWRVLKIKQETIRSNRPKASSTVLYGDLFYLINHKNGNYLHVSTKNEKSPATEYVKVSCATSGKWHCISTNSENPPYVRSKDTINLLSNQVVLRSHGFTFTRGDETYQEVAGHKEEICGNDEWCIEIITQQK
ncbi:hypothetical protein C1645_807887 [Glomus cerebriforme]|uniref:MIR domain-containing protein n=1 Tax=Glomus cerebriforme TaxID=658196 RepID=A0A397SQ98_9GLOM|nr:hypothetical protein C1645_807887 [Glomus cerebriforme]